MTITFKMPHPEPDLKPRITVVGVGGAGGNAVNNMIINKLEGVEFVVTNTDAQALAQSRAERRIQLGRQITQGLGAGSRPDVGKAAAEEAIDEIIEQIQNSNMVFITAGMGGGTGTGAAPVVARAAREQGILTVGVVTKPFQFEGLNRQRIADEGIAELQHYVDTLIIIPNQNLFRIANEKTTFAQAFELADNVLYSGVRGVTDLMVMPGLINLDFADVRQVMSEMGKAMMGTGEAEGESRATAAAEAAISNPLLDDVSMEGAKGVLINITGGMDMTLFEVDEAANRIRSEVDPAANIIFGSTFDESLEGKVRISVIATGIDAEAAVQPSPLGRISLVSDNSTDPRRMAPMAATPPEPVQAQPATGTTESMPAGNSMGNLDSTGTVAPTDTQASVNAPLQEIAPSPRGGIHGDADRPFLPEAPVMAPERVERASTRPAPDPLAEAALVNAGKPGMTARSLRKGLSLFERVTGARKSASTQETPVRREPGSRLGGEPRLTSADSLPRQGALKTARPETVDRTTEGSVERPEAGHSAMPETSPAMAPASKAGAENRPTAPVPSPAPGNPALRAAPQAAHPVAPAAGPVRAQASIPPAAPRKADQNQAGFAELDPTSGSDRDVPDDLLEIPAFLRRQAN